MGPTVSPALPKYKALVQRFDDDWRAGIAPQIADYLDLAVDAPRDELFRQLLSLDIQHRRAAGEELSLEQYVRRFPDLRGIINDQFPTQDGKGATEIDPAAAANLGRRAPAASPCDRLGNYHLIREIGRGGMGVVFEAIDTRDGTRVALKTLRTDRPRSIAAFKDEFRALADLAHRNLVALGTLVTTGEQPFFTMELIEGRNFLQHVRADYDSAAAGSRTAVDAARLLDAFRQLAEGLQTLHDAGKLHRDIKATNVLVTDDGRVVILDFGLAVELREGEYQTHAIAGTPAAMPPEQRTGGAMTAATDWYAAGVMLSEALGGRGPATDQTAGAMDAIPGSPRVANPPPAEIIAGLTALSHELLREKPSDRPTGAEILRRLSGKQIETRGAAAWVGREAEIGALGLAANVVRRGKPLVVLLHGPSGIGKSSLVKKFLDGLQHCVVLRGRCFESESVPYNAFDGIVDQLYHFLRRLRDEQIERLLPLDVSNLCRIFPTLMDIPAVREAAGDAKTSLDVQELRQQAFAALREVFSRMVRFERTLLVLFIDDLQWADRDSAELLLELVRQPGAPALLLVAAYRSEDAEGNECLRAIRTLDLPEAECRAFAEQREVALERLSPEEAGALALSLLSNQPDAAARAEAIARESSGSPLFVKFLSQSLTLSSESDAAHPLTLNLGDVLWREICRLSPAEKAIVEVVAVAGRPLARSIVYRAAGFADSDVTSYGQLKNRRFIRAASISEDGGEMIEAYHDRVRETVVEHLPGERIQQICAAVVGLLEQIEAYHNRVRETVLEHVAGERIQQTCAAVVGLLEQNSRRIPNGWLICISARAIFPRRGNTSPKQRIGPIRHWHSRKQCIYTIAPSIWRRKPPRTCANGSPTRCRTREEAPRPPPSSSSRPPRRPKIGPSACAAGPLSAT